MYKTHSICNNRIVVELKNKLPIDAKENNKKIFLSTLLFVISFLKNIIKIAGTIFNPSSNKTAF